MGDRTSVEIRISMRSYEHPAVKAWVDGEDWPGEAFPEAPEDIWEDALEGREGRVLYFSECNYGGLPDVEKFLRGNKVSYDFSWGAGDDYTAGTRWVRFSKDGSLRVTEAYDSDKPDLEFIQEQLELGRHGAALSYLRNWREDHEAPCLLGNEPDTWPKRWVDDDDLQEG